MAAARRAAAATNAVPTDTTLVVERFRDELGDWRVIMHSPYGLRVHGPLALAVGRRLRERYGIDEKPTASDDGIVVRLPDSLDRPTHAAGRRAVRLRADEIEPIVTAEVGGSALFASRFRECAARALLLPRRHPGQAVAAVAAAPARRPAAGRGPQVPRLPDRAGGGARVPAGRLRRAGADRADGTDRAAPGARRRGRDRHARRRSPRRCCSATSPRSCTRATARWPSAAPRRCRWTPRCWPSCSAASSCASCSTPTSSPPSSRQLQHLTADRAARDAEGVADLLRLLGPLTARRGRRARSTAD